jgi:hypothetical protein
MVKPVQCVDLKQKIRTLDYNLAPKARRVYDATDIMRKPRAASRSKVADRQSIRNYMTDETNLCVTKPHTMGQPSLNVRK